MRNQCLEIHWRLLTWLFSVASLISVLCPEMVNARLPKYPNIYYSCHLLPRTMLPGVWWYGAWMIPCIWCVPYIPVLSALALFPLLPNIGCYMHSITILSRSCRVLHVIHHMPHDGFCIARHGLFFPGVIHCCCSSTHCLLYCMNLLSTHFIYTLAHALFLPWPEFSVPGVMLLYTA